MKKKILSVLASTAILGSMACVSAVNTSAFAGQITFEVPENWAKTNKTFYAHIWDGTPGGEGLYGWQTAEEEMTISEDKKTATYEVPEGDWNLIIISSDVPGAQTYDTVFNANCIGDTCYVGKEMESGPVDSPSYSYNLFWRNNPDCGPHKVVNSLGVIIGTSFLPGETNQSLYDDFVKKYNPQNSIDGIVDYEEYFDWNDDGRVATGMSWEEITAELATKLGVVGETPTEAPTEAPTAEATVAPTEAPTEAPTAKPTTAPTQAPTSAPTSANTNAGKGTVNTSQGATLAVLATTVLASLGVLAVINKKRENNN
ncbi:MAG: PT domain-containing protein [Acutalibacteraceae bacterium]|nr:PT domain-containing protein [Acutalibacteraceae bacterium]